ncbi:MAG: PstS family phosphate ABC transporter substrate-binding protein [Armatimonadetes bacterium]|nr:PstS family phosphate ABC transporter substrate-binding protein [Armatimonadota bacterium]
MNTKSSWQIAAFALCGLMVLAGCGNSGAPANGTSDASGSGGGSLAGDIKVDGSSTVLPISEAVAEEFGGSYSGVRVTVAESGTGGGFKKFIAGEIDVADASRPIKDEEDADCAKAKIEYVELPIAYDGIAIVVNPKNTWAKSITVDELKKLWAPEAQGKVMKWSDIRAGWPDRPVKLYGPGTDSGTFEYFTEAIVGKKNASRGDYSASEDDNVLVQGIAGDEGALGYFGLSYYLANKDKLSLVAVDDGNADNGAGPIAASETTVRDGTYQPLSRPLFIYIKKSSLDQPHVAAFAKFYIQNAATLSAETGYVALPDSAYPMIEKRLQDKVLGSVFKDSKPGMKIEDLLKKEQGG